MLRRRITVEETRKIKELRDREGMSYGVIGKMFGRSKSTVYRIIHGDDAQDLTLGSEDTGGRLAVITYWEENEGQVEERDQ